MYKSWFKKPEVKGRCICNEHWKQNEICSLHWQRFITPSSVFFFLFYYFLYCLLIVIVLTCSVWVLQSTQNTVFWHLNTSLMSTRQHRFDLHQVTIRVSCFNLVYMSFYSCFSTLNSASSQAKVNPLGYPVWTWNVHWHEEKTDDNSKSFNLQAIIWGEKNKQTNKKTTLPLKYSHQTVPRNKLYLRHIRNIFLKRYFTNFYTFLSEK